MMGVRILAVLMAMVVLNAEGVMRNAEFGYDARGARCEVELSGVEGEGGVIEILLQFASEGGICGIYGEMFYDADEFLLLSCGADAEEMVFSYYDCGGEVRILLDGVENYCGEGALVRFYFGRAEGAVRGGVFSLGKIEAFCFSEEGGFSELGVDIESDTFEVGACRGAEERSVPVLSDIEILSGENGEVKVLLSGEVSGDYFAAGFKIFAVEVDSGKSETVYVLGVIGSGGEALFERSAVLSARGAASIVVTPLAFWRGGAVEGEKYACVAGGIKNPLQTMLCV